MKKLLGILLFSLYILLFPLLATALPVYAVGCDEELPSNAPPGVLNDYIADCRAKLSQNRGAQATLASAIKYLNSQIFLTQAQISASEKELDRLELEITDLNGKIDSIDYSLDGLTRLFVARVREAYMREESLPVVTIADTGKAGIPDFIRKLEYAKKIRDHDREILVSLEKSRLDFNSQKTEKEEKQAAVVSVQKKLTAQKVSLSVQKAAKDKLLADTQNDEKKYASLIQKAQTQLASFRRFVSSQGGAALLGNETRCDGWGCYYNQRDSAWGNQFMGLSDSLMREYGCLVTSMAMIASHYGKSLKPGDIAGSSAPFFGSTAYMNQGSWSVNGVTMSRTRLSGGTAAIDAELAAGRPVVVGIYGGPDHFLVIKAKEGSDYIMHDPYPAGGADLKFTSKYPLSAINTVDRVSVN